MSKGFEVHLSLEHDEALRKHINRLIEDQVKSVARKSIKGILFTVLAQKTEKPFSADNLDKLINKILEDHIFKALKIGGYSTDAIRITAQEAVKAKVDEFFEKANESGMKF